ncbi:unnamed protein product [Eruca vesicaria subsp. sativa]|uniref:Uncharacterized protein n=1 Tax=Eruca vesicaria subsp. sativa TaxID=29727 RepID=A0ABC8K116_ERUVS|nr:unnamed protein product [Eruca vesicaria subsp. sativa]
MSASYISSSTYEPRKAEEHPKRAGMVENIPARKKAVNERDINESAEAFIQKFRKQLLLQSAGINFQ